MGAQEDKEEGNGSEGIIIELPDEDGSAQDSPAGRYRVAGRSVLFLMKIYCPRSPPAKACFPRSVLTSLDLHCKAPYPNYDRTKHESDLRISLSKGESSYYVCAPEVAHDFLLLD